MPYLSLQFQIKEDLDEKIHNMEILLEEITDDP